MKKVIFIMGVSGCGKSTVGKLLAQRLDIPFFDGDDFHSKESIFKMSEGQPLNDRDRKGWLIALNKLAKEHLTKSGCVIACSALKQVYRNTLSLDIEKSTKWIHLFGSFEQIHERLNNRPNHFMSVELLQSQFDILEKPTNVINMDISMSPEEIVNAIQDGIINTSEIGIFGLGVMGKSLSRNLASKGFKISMFNRHVDNIEEKIAKNFKAEFNELTKALAFDDIEAFVNSLQRPRKIVLMVNSGKTIDLVIKNLLPHLNEEDIIIDGGNSNYKKTKERLDFLKEQNIHFIGAGISGGEEGALIGPSIMPSGNLASYNSVKPFLEAIAAKDQKGAPCCTYIGPEGSGHFIKMVHNGIEYVEMQLLAEVATILGAIGQNPDEIADTLESWKDTASSYLLDITSTIFRKKEGEDWLVNKILDKAGNKGTGNWTTIASSELGVPSTLIASALFSRYISFYKDERQQLNRNYKNGGYVQLELNSNDVKEAYQFARIINHYQGFKLIHQASEFYGWNLNLSEIARIWTSGCIIKSKLMQDLVKLFQKETNLLATRKSLKALSKYRPSAKKVVLQSILNDLAIPVLNEAVQFFNGITSANSSANIIQAQRDYFGAHTYQRIDDETGKLYHTKWKQ